MSAVLSSTPSPGIPVLNKSCCISAWGVFTGKEKHNHHHCEFIIQYIRFLYMIVACIVCCNSLAATSMVLLNSWEPPFSLGVLLLSTLPGILIEGQILLCWALFRQESEVISYSRKPSPDVRQDNPSGQWRVVKWVKSKLTDFSRKLWDYLAVGQDLSTVCKSKAVLQLDLLINQAIRQLHCSKILVPL